MKMNVLCNCLLLACLVTGCARGSPTLRELTAALNQTRQLVATLKTDQDIARARPQLDACEARLRKAVTAVGQDATAHGGTPDGATDADKRDEREARQQMLTEFHRLDSTSDGRHLEVDFTQDLANAPELTL